MMGYLVILRKIRWSRLTLRMKSPAMFLRLNLRLFLAEANCSSILTISASGIRAPSSDTTGIPSTSQLLDSMITGLSEPG